MDANNELQNIHNHGTVIDKKRTRVQCNYCGKGMSGFSRLKYHLGGVRGDVLPCDKVPSNLQSVMRDWVIDRKQEKMSREAVNLFESSVPLERNIGLKLCASLSPERNLGSTVAKHGLGLREGSRPTSSGKRKKVVDQLAGEAEASNDIRCSEMDDETPDGRELEGSTKHLLRCIGRFFYDSGIDFGVSSSPYFRNMIEAAINHGQGYKIPRYKELKGWLLQEEVQEVQEHVKRVEQSWEKTGCSILIDTWTSEKGKTLVSVIVYSLKGTIFLKSIDASDSVGDVDKLFLLYDRVIQEVGVNNVVQVITHDASSTMKAVGKKILEKHQTLFWNQCGFHCIGLILEEIGKMDQVKKLLSEAKALTKFIYSHNAILKLLKVYTGGKDIVRCSKFLAATPFVTLEAMKSQKENLKIMFESSTWNNSEWASNVEGKKFAQLVQVPSFWARVDDVLHATIPFVRFMQLLNDAYTPTMGIIYETMDQVKERIKENFKSTKPKYLPVWEVVDEVWNNQLHSALHSAGYYLNPGLYFSDNFWFDDEVSFDLMRCIMRMAENNLQTRDYVIVQLEDYKERRGGFSKPIVTEQIFRIHPGLWWSSYADHIPELQKIAVRILNQTCTGSLKFNLKWDLLEKLHSKTPNGIDDKSLSDLAFVHYNLQLKNHKYQFFMEEIDPMVEWVRPTPGVIPFDDRENERNAETSNADTATGASPKPLIVTVKEEQE
ncbi:hypothetical protein H6P81_010121 [Aristolochia fimbriata]|uniref:DUF659 domain-containing protein n=1 Tax=Aristolochia fimbriata TaxID=158543 RepID=A0AAV7EP23_ARIFI|nr:hypothetical protein H6P81_010121 [Aristolochia fimbriata]